MANTLGTLIISLQAQTTAFAKGMKDANQLAFTTSSEIVASLGKVGDQLSKLKFSNEAQWKKSAEIIGGTVAGIGIAVASASVVVAREVAGQVKEMSKLSQSYGLSITEVSQLRVASALTGVSLEQLSIGMGRLAKAAAATAEGSAKQTRAFQTLGISVTDGGNHLRGMNDLLADVAGKFSKLQDGTGKTALAMELFGRSGATLIPFLNRGSEGIKQLLDLSDQLGMTWSENDAKNAEVFKESLEILDLKGEALKENFVKGLLPALDGISNAFVKADKTGASMAKTLGTEIGEAALFAAEKFDWLTTKIAQAVVAMQGVGRFATPWSEVKLQLQALTDMHQKFVAQLRTPLPALAGGGEGSDVGLGRPSFTGGKTTADKAPDFLALVNEAKALFDVRDAYQKLSDKIVEFQALHPETIFLSLNEALVQLSAKLKLVQSDADDALRSVQGGGWQSQAALAKQIGDVLATPMPLPEDPAKIRALYDPMGRYADQLNRVSESYKHGYINGTAYLQLQKEIAAAAAYDSTLNNPKSGMAGVKQGLGAGAAVVGASWQGISAETANTMIQLAHRMQSAFADAFTSMVMGTKSVGQAFAELGINILGSIVSALAEMLAKWITTHTIMLIFGKSIQAAEIATHIAGNVIMATSDAAVAAAGTLALMSAIAPPPIPEALAALTYAAGLGFAGLASMAVGGLLPRDMVIQAHAGEAVLPRKLTDYLLGAANQHQPAFAGGFGAPMTFNVSGSANPIDTANKIASVVQARMKRIAKSKGLR